MRVANVLEEHKKSRSPNQFKKQINCTLMVAWIRNVISYFVHDLYSNLFRACILSEWIKGNLKSMPFAVPMVIQELKDRINDLYFCLTNITGHSSKTKLMIKYLDIPSALKPKFHEVGLLVPADNLRIKEQGSKESERKNEQHIEMYIPKYRVMLPHTHMY
ncbi:hypothetical protein NPIL_23611 [Nephila pilipes]|uniref:Uncharacterized protein n=1 Tax=Nephila pilipes TaxID=299642 RepID=A0A8X6J385_NEPPI|nr:hypothetical protein NPIL_23611 [Nephila pilipes]